MKHVSGKGACCDICFGISTSTVGTYVQRIYEKLHVSSRREIMARSGKHE
jgi:DNA-binding CsgD family transcriptional regulator